MTIECLYFPDCAEPAWKSDLCRYHYGRKQYLQQIGKPDHEVKSWRWHTPLEERLWAEVVKPDDPDACWMWTGRIVKGYGQIWNEGKHHYTHAVVYELMVGPVPDGLDLDHECHNKAAEHGACVATDECPHRACCNPTHLAPKPRGDNLKASPLWRSSVGYKGDAE